MHLPPLPSSETLLSHQINSVLTRPSLLFSPFSQDLATTKLCSVSINLFILDISHRWNHTIHDPMSDFFHLAKCSRGSPYCIMYQYIIFFLQLNNIRWHAHASLFTHSSFYRHLGCLHHLATIKVLL